MSLKTDCAFYNDDNFVEEYGQILELTVEITLKEYRNLISEITRQDILISDLQDRNKELEEKLESATKAFACIKLPEWLEKFKEVFGSNTEQSNEEITEETESETENDEPV